VLAALGVMPLGIIVFHLKSPPARKNSLSF